MTAIDAGIPSTGSVPDLAPDPEVERLPAAARLRPSHDDMRTRLRPFIERALSAPA